jgi:hypothetical protein
MQAAAWLVNTSHLYREQAITIDQNWMTYFDPTISNEDEWSEDEAEISAWCN